MRKLLLAATILGLAVAPAFAGGIAGDADIGISSANSTAGVSSSQGTQAGVTAAKNGGVVVGAVSGNYTAVDTSAMGATSPKGASYTNTTATQTNIGGTVGGGVVGNTTNGTSGSASGNQSSTANGGANATAKNLNVGGFATVSHGRGGGR